MISLRSKDYVLKVSISKEEKITITKAKNLIRKARRMTQQNRLTSIIVVIDNSRKIDENVLSFYNKVLCNSSDFPVAMINNG